jgi:hypothetical protein
MNFAQELVIEKGPKRRMLPSMISHADLVLSELDGPLV